MTLIIVSNVMSQQSPIKNRQFVAFHVATRRTTAESMFAPVKGTRGDQIMGHNGGMFTLKAFSVRQDNDIKHFLPSPSCVASLFTVHHPKMLSACVSRPVVWEAFISKRVRVAGTVKAAIFQQIIDLFNANEYNFHLRASEKDSDSSRPAKCSIKTN